MDLVNYSETRFREIETNYRQWLGTIGIEPKAFIPIVARDGDLLTAANRLRDYFDLKPVKTA